MNDTFYEAFFAELASIEKTANMLTKKLLSVANPTAILSKLPTAMREQASYKLLGHKARRAVYSSMPEGAGHGAQHVWDVTRDTQKLLGQGVDPTTYRRGVLSSLLHDIGRPAEMRSLSNLQTKFGPGVGKIKFDADPTFAHSELSGRYAKNFLAQNKSIVKNVPGLQQGRLSGSIRAHDTDVHARLPWTKQRLVQDPAAGATYLADKIQGLGVGGVKRTIETGAHLGQSPAQSYAYAMNKNMPKYHNVINTYAPEHLRPELVGRLKEYHTGMNQFAAKNNIPTIPWEKQAMAIQDYVNLFNKGIKRKTRTKVLRRAVRMLHRKNPKGFQEAFHAVYKVPESERYRLLTEVL